MFFAVDEHLKIYNIKKIRGDFFKKDDFTSWFHWQGEALDVFLE